MTKILQFKITLFGSQPLIWRQFQVTDDYRFDRFHQVVFLVMGWMNSHLHEFNIDDRKIGMLLGSGIESIRGRKPRPGTRYEKGLITKWYWAWGC